MNKSIVIALAATLLVAACKSDKKTTETATPVEKTAAIVADNKYLIGSKTMGTVSIGMTKADVLIKYPTAKEDTVNLEAEIPCLSILDEDGSILFQATYQPGTDTIESLLTSHPKMATAKNIKIGSVYAALLAEYPDLKVAFIEGYVAISEKGNIMFSIEGEIVMDIIDEATMKTKLKSVSPDTKATMISIQ